MKERFTSLQDLAMIGDRRTCALLDKEGNMVWYCPKRFDNPSLFAYLLDPEKGGSWALNLKGLKFSKRLYLEDSALLQTWFSGKNGNLLLRDWMPVNSRFCGICRELSPAPVSYDMRLSPRPNYSRRRPDLRLESETHAVLEFDFHLYASHPLRITGDDINCEVPAGEAAWFILAEKMLDRKKCWRKYAH